MKTLLLALLILVAPDSAQAAYAAEQLAVDACEIAAAADNAALALFDGKTELVALTVTHSLKTYIRTALDSGTTADTDSYTSLGRKEMVKKALMNVLPVSIMQSKMSAAVTAEDSAAGTGSAAWLYAQAVYTGTNDGSRPLKADGGALDSPDAVADSACTAYITANKRCGNFDTCVATPTTDKSHTNAKIMEAFGKGASQENANTITAQLCTVYYQATLRYLNKMDKENKEGATSSNGKNQGEGQAFSMAIAACPGLPTDQYNIIKALYDTATANKKTTNYCTGLTLLAKHPATGMTPTDLGTLKEATAQVCDAATASSLSGATAALLVLVATAVAGGM